MTEQKFNQFSFLYPDAAAKQAHFAGKDAARIDDFTFEELGLCELLPLQNGRLSEFVTADPRVIAYRQGIFGDMLKNPGVSTMLGKLIPILFDISDLRTLESENGDDTNYLAGMTEIELYIAGIGILHEGLCGKEASFESAAFCELADYVKNLVESDYYAELNRRLADLATRVREIKSVTVGVNLDAQLRPCEAGVLAINPEQFHSGDTLHKIMRLNFKDDEYTCIANLVPFGKKQSENQKTALSLAFTSAINDVYRQSLRSWKKIVQTYVLENTDFLLDLLPEFEFLLKGTNLLRALEVRGNTITKPTLAERGTRTFSARGLYNPVVALKIDDEIVKNDLVFDDKAAIYVLTGPNRGGKSVITCAAGLALAMTQLGLFVAADEMTVSPADAIFTHFPTGADDTIDKGRLGEECARLGEILSAITGESFVLLDESLSSTGSYEASVIAAEVLAGLSRVGCRGIFSTHLHELAAQLDQINARTAPDGGAPIDTLVAGIEGAGRRSFLIRRAKPDGKSYARDIAEKYGLSYESIVKNLKK